MTAQAHPMTDHRPRPCRIRGHHSRAQHATYCRPACRPDDFPPYPDDLYAIADPSAYRALRRRLRRMIARSA